MTKIKSLDDIPDFQQIQKHFNEVNRLAALANSCDSIPVSAVKEATALILEGAKLLKDEFNLASFVDKSEDGVALEVDQQHIDRLKEINKKIEVILERHLPTAS